MFKNTKKILKGLGKTALGVGAIVSVAMVAYGAANAHISSKATQVANMTAGDKQATMKIIQEYSPVAVGFSDLISPSLDKILGNKDDVLASTYFINKACDTIFEKFKNGAIEHEKSVKNGKASQSLEKFVLSNIDHMQNFSINFFQDNELVDYVKQNIDTNQIVQNFISEYKESKVDNNKILEQGLKNKKFLSYNDFKGKLTQNHSEDSLKQKYEDYTKDKIKELSKVQDTNPSIDYDNSIQMKV